MESIVPRPKRTMVLAGNYNEFSNYCWYKLSCSPEMARRNYNVYYIRDSQSLRGQGSCNFERYGSWQDRRDLAELEAEIQWLTARYAAEAEHHQMQGIKPSLMIVDEINTYWQAPRQHQAVVKPKPTNEQRLSKLAKMLASL